MRTALASLALTLALTSTPAQAECAGPLPDVVWSYPAPDQTDVPPNAKLFLLPPPASVQLNGSDLDQLAEPLWDPGTLTAGETYVVDYTMPARDDGTTPTTGSFTFTVGAIPVEPIAVTESDLGEPSRLDRDASACFVETDFNCSDDYPIGEWGSDVAVPGVILWGNGSINAAWQPATCAGAPAVDVGLENAGTYCDEIVAYGADGSSVTGLTLCATVTECELYPSECDDGDAGPTVTDDVASGCSCSSGGLALFVAPLLAPRRRRTKLKP